MLSFSGNGNQNRLTRITSNLQRSRGWLAASILLLYNHT